MYNTVQNLVKNTYFGFFSMFEFELFYFINLQFEFNIFCFNIIGSF